MPTISYQVSTPIVRSARVRQLEGMFDIPPTDRSELAWELCVPIETRPWQIGLIAGPSGSGKTTLARKLFADGGHGDVGFGMKQANNTSSFDVGNLEEDRAVPGETNHPVVIGLDHEFVWLTDRALIDAFPPELSIRVITGLLSSVGFSSPPSWLKPFQVLSQGEQFRARLARSMAEAVALRHRTRRAVLVVIDEFTSVVDRTVAKVASFAIAKAIRRLNVAESDARPNLPAIQLVAVSCHHDVIDWLNPDWVCEPGIASFQWRELRRPHHTIAGASASGDDQPATETQPTAHHERASSHRVGADRPAIALVVHRVAHQAWRIFKRHHYLSGELNKAAHCYVGCVEGRPACFVAVLPFPHPTRPGWREHRVVCLPDFQGVGIGNAMSEHIASLYAATGKPYRSVTSSPAMIAHRARSSKWLMTRAPSIQQVSIARNLKRPSHTDSADHAPDVLDPSLTGASHPSKQSHRRRQPMATLNRTAANNRLTASFEYVG